MLWPVLMATVIVATPIPLKRLGPLEPALRPGSTAAVSSAGENVPCWDSPASMTVFTNAFRAHDRPAMALAIANNAVLLEEGVKVRALETSGALRGALKLKLLSGEHAGTICYEQSVLQIYRSIRAPRRRA